MVLENCQNCLTPTMINSDSIEITQVTKTTVSRTTNLNNEQYENFILYNLIKNNSPNDVSINTYSIPSGLDTNNTNLTIQKNDPGSLIQHTIINNNDKYIQSEKFALNVEYADTPSVTQTTTQTNLPGPNNISISSNITLTNKTVSYYDSNLKVDISYNNDAQYTAGSDPWSVTMNRNENTMNYFAAINSHLNTTEADNNAEKYPFRIYEDISTNQYSLGADGIYFTQTGNNQRVAHNFVNDLELVEHTLAANNLEVERNDYTNFNRDDFGTYKIAQNPPSDSNIQTTIKSNNEDVSDITDEFPIGSSTGGNITTSLISFEDVLAFVDTLDSNNSSKVSSGFSGTLDVSVGGGYSCASNEKFSINDNSLTVSGSDENLNYFTNGKSNNRHYVDISNGSVTLDSTNPNVSAGYITLSNGIETLPSPYNTTQGEVQIKSTATSGRVANRSGTLANQINVYYNLDEGDSQISNNLREAGDVSYNVKLLVESTSNNADETYDAADDTRNLAKNTVNNDSVDSRLVIANDNKPVNFDIRSQTSFKFLDEESSNTIRKSGHINILNIENKNKLVQDGPLCSALNEDLEIDTTSNISGTSCDVTLLNTPLNNMPYTDYRIKLDTKNANDINTSTQPTNGWTFDLTLLQNDSLGLASNYAPGTILGDSNHRSEIIPDVFSFLQGTAPVNIEYKLNVDSTASSLNYIKYYFDVSSNDLLSQNQRYSFGYNDTQFQTVTDISDTKLANVSSDNVSGTNSNNYIFERWLRRKQYNAILDASLPFYRNLVLKTTVINEENVYYRAWNKSTTGEKGNEISPIILQSFALDSQAMNIVNVRLVQSFGSTNETGTDSVSVSTDSTLKCNIVLKPEDCGIFKTKLQGKDLSNNVWNDLGTAVAHIDPYIKQTGTISNYDTNKITGNDFSCQLRVAFPLNVLVTKPTYYIDITNPLNDPNNFEMTASLYSFNTTDINANTGLIDAFSPYKSTFTGSVIAGYKTSTNYLCDLSLNTGTNKYKLTISHLVSSVSKKDVEIEFPKDYVLNFNIINSESNLLSVNRTIDSASSFLGYRFESVEGGNRTFRVEDGVYVTLVNNVVAGMQETFSLIRDEAKVNFVSNINGEYYRPTNSIAYNWRENWQTIQLNSDKQFIASNTLTPDSLWNTHGGTKSVIFHKTRGYNATQNTISINRTATAYKFILDASNVGTGGTEGQIYEQIWEGGVTTELRIDDLVSTSSTSGLWQNNVVAGDNKVHLDIGLLLNINQSILADTDTDRIYEITPSAAPYTYEFKNPAGSSQDIVNGTPSGNPTLFDGVLSGFFNFKVRSLKATIPIRIKLEYVSSAFVISFNPSYTTKPSNITSWTTIRNFAPELTSVGNLMSFHPTVSSYHISLKRTAEKTGVFVSYLVCAPPSYGIEFNAEDSYISSLPFAQSSNTRTKVHVDAVSSSNTYNLYDVVGLPAKISNHLHVNSPDVNLQQLRLSEDINRKNLIVNGNTLKISIYNGLTDHSPSALIEGTINGGIQYDGLINAIVNSPPRNQYKFKAALIGNGYDISYSQPLTGITEIANDSFNINLTITHAFIPKSISYLTLPINKSSRVTLYDSRFHYGYNGKYYLILHKYINDAGVDYNALLAPNSNIRQVSFRLDKKSQKSIELYMLDNSGNRALVNPINLSDASNVNNLLDNLNVNDLSGNWSETSLPIESAGVSLAALDITGMASIRNLLVYNPSDRLSHKTLFIKRADIFRVYSSVGSPVLRITNSGNIITPKVTTSMVSLLQQSVVTGSRDITYGTEAVASGLFSEGALDFSGNWLQ